MDNNQQELLEELLQENLIPEYDPELFRDLSRSRKAAKCPGCRAACALGREFGERVDMDLTCRCPVTR